MGKDKHMYPVYTESVYIIYFIYTDIFAHLLDQKPIKF